MTTKMTTNLKEMSDEIEKILNKPYGRRLIPDEDGGYVAMIQEFPGCVAEGDTPDEAIKNLDKAAASWVQVALSNGYEIRDPVSFFGYSGKIALRIPRGLHKQVAELAQQEDTSINQLLATAIAQYVGGKRAMHEISESIFREMGKTISSSVESVFQSRPIVILMQGQFGPGTQIAKTAIGGHVIENHMPLPAPH